MSFTSSKHIIKSTLVTFPFSHPSPSRHLLHTLELISSSVTSKPFSILYSSSLRKLSGVSPFSHTNALKPVCEAYLGTAEVETSNSARMELLKVKMEDLGIDISSCKSGEYTHLLCPKCKGGQTLESSLSLHVNLNGEFSMWRCFRDACGWAGRIFADDRATNDEADQVGLRLEPLGHKLIDYFAERMISEETLQRNGVMQIAGDQYAIAFPYRKHGVVVGCKYRTIGRRRFWQVKGTEKEFYGLDDIKDSAEIIIVEGEIDKLSMEEAGFYNCVSVPNGAPQKVSTKELPPLEKDIAFQFLWSSKDYFYKATRIVLATDADSPGQALAEELSRRLGIERCWRVNWPKKDEVSCCKDANEVLKTLGADSLKEMIANAEMWELESQAKTSITPDEILSVHTSTI